MTAPVDERARVGRASGVSGPRPSLAARAILRMIDGYQFVSSRRPTPCRFVPDCSHYSGEAIQVHGARRGLLLTLRRLSRCHPWGPSGPDPVPKKGGPRV